MAQGLGTKYRRHRWPSETAWRWHSVPGVPGMAGPMGHALVRQRPQALGWRPGGRMRRYAGHGPSGWDRDWGAHRPAGPVEPHDARLARPCATRLGTRGEGERARGDRHGGPP